jgi:UDP-N-acetylglucosamine 2-epimerase (non-hydrolysing)
MIQPDRPAVTCVVGARPNFMKIKPVLDAFDRRAVATRLVHTGQHYDESMSQVFFDDLRLRRPDVHLGIGAGTHAEQVAGVLVAMEALLAKQHTDAVVVVGDVNSTLGAALAAAKTPALVAHVEAGLRSGDWSMPEEVNRLVTDRVSDLLCAPSAGAVENLRREGHPDENIELVGDVMAEMLHLALPAARRRPILRNLGLAPRSYALATMHRPSNVDNRDRLRELLETLDELAVEIPVVLPLHPRTRRRMNEYQLPGPKAATLIEPLGYLDFVALEANARLVLTDSGSVQEEARTQGLPCLTLRESTERPDTLGEGLNHLVGHDRTAILAAAKTILDRPNDRRSCAPVRCVGERIVSAVMERIS